jgi:putative ABC transport system permease protein
MGLAVGMAIFILILSYVQNELSYDSFHEKTEQLYRLMRNEKMEGNIEASSAVPAPLAPALLNDFPEIIHAVRMTGTGGMTINHKDKSFVERRLILADSSFFEAFSFPLVKGNPKTALQDKYSVVITEEIAEKYFGGEDPIGKILTCANRIDLKVTAVAKNLPLNTVLDFDFLSSFELINELFGFNYLDSWGAFNFSIYVMAREDILHSEFEKKSVEACQRYRPSQTPDHQSLYSLFLQPITKVHLGTDVMAFVYIFSAIAFFILILACVNFMNLAVAQSSTREKEVGMRKVIGANRFQLIKQFLGESVFLSFVSLPIAVCIVELLLPVYNALLNLNLKMNYFQNWMFIFGLLAIALLVGIISGSYPAFYASAMRPVRTLKSVLRSAPKRTILRSILVVSQFSVSIILVIGTIVMHNQLHFIRNRDLGFNKENILSAVLYDRNLSQNYESLKSELLRNPNVLSASGNYFMGGGNNTVQWEGMKENDYMVMRYFTVDADFLETFQIELLEGRNFQKGSQSDVKYSYLLNESAVKALGWESGVGKQFEVQMSGSEMGQVIGVVKDFHFQTLHREIRPLALKTAPSFSLVSLKIAPDDIPGTIAFVRSQIKERAPSAPFEYYFVDNNIDKMYRSEKIMSRMLSHFSFLAIFIACLGLLGLTSYSIIQRTREIGIRKVLGASTSTIVVLLTKQFTKWVLVANIIAWPIAYYAMSRLLQFYAYRISLGIWMFLLAAFLALVIAIFTVSVQAMRAALANPADALRYE